MLYSQLKVIGLVCAFAIATTNSLPAKEEARGSRNSIQTENDLLDSIYSDCLRKDSLTCVKYKLFSFVDKMIGNRDTITVTEGVQIVKTEDGEPEGAPRAITADDTIESILWNRAQRFLETHTVKIDLQGKEIVNALTSTARSFSEALEGEEENGVEEGRGKKKKAQRILGPLLAAAALKMAILGKLALAAIALLAGKALLVGKIALVLSAIIGLKKLFAGSGKHVTYEVVAHPQHSSSHVASHETVYGGSASGGYGGDGYGGSSGHGGWQRSLDAQQMAYKGQIPKQQ